MADQFNENEWEVDTPKGEVTATTTDAWEADDSNMLGVPTDWVEASQTDNLDYILNQAKLGLTDSASLANALVETVVVDPAKALAWYAGLDVKPPPDSPIASFFKHLGESMQAGAAITGAEPSMQPPDAVSKYAGAAVRAMADPANLVFPGGPVANVITSGVGGVGAEFGGNVGEQTAGAPGAVIGSLLGGGTAALSGPVIKSTVTKPVIDAVTSFRTKMQTYKDAPETAAAGHAQRFMERAEQELSPATLNDMVGAFERIRYVVGGADIPLFVAMADSPSVRAQIVNLVKTDPATRAAIEQQTAILAKKLDDKADAFFGKRYVTTDNTIVDISNVSARVQSIDNQINKITEGLTPTRSPEQAGEAIANLVKARISAITEEMSPKYTELMQEARAANIKMPSEGTQSIYKFVIQNRIRDIFGKGTPVDNDIMKYFAPNKKGVFKEVSFDRIDSLKKEINRLQRGRLAPEESRKLMQLEEVVNEARQGIPDNFNTRLIDLDREYYLRLGVPFGEQGIKDIDAKKYAEQIAPILTNNASAMRQFLRAVGSDGHGVATDAVISKVYQQFVKDGVLNTAGLRNYIKNNKAMLEQVPGLLDRLNKASSDVSSLQLAKQRINKQAAEAEKIIANNFLSKLGQGEAANYAEMASRVMNDPTYLGKIFGDLRMASPATSKAAKNALRREVLEVAMNSTEGATNYLTNPKRAQQVDALFGTQYRGTVMDIAKMQDALQRADVGKITDALNKSALEKTIAGLTPSTTISVLRDRITSFAQKIAILGSRAVTARMEKADKEAMIDLLVDPKGLEKLANKKKAFPDLQNPLNAAKMYTQFIDLLPNVFYTPAKQEAFKQEERNYR